jgi:hypothetical protein
LAADAPALVYSCKVCRGGDPADEPIGVIGTVFNWSGLGEKVVADTPLDPSERQRTRCYIVDPNGRILADSTGQTHVATFELEPIRALLAQPKGFAILDRDGERVLYAQARSPGFETYATGWHALIVQRVAR